MAKRNQTRSDASGVHLWLLLWKASKAVEVQARRSVKATGLCLSDFGVLEALLHKGPLPISALGKKVLLSSGSMTAAVDRLERSGFVERAAASADRRSRIVHLTKKGSNLIRKMFAEHERDLERVFSRLDRRERNALASLLRNLGHEAEEIAATEAKPVENKQGRNEKCQNESKYWVFMERHRPIGWGMGFPCGQCFPRTVSKN